MAETTATPSAIGSDRPECEPTIEAGAQEQTGADELDGYSFRSAKAADADAVAQLVDAAYRHYVERIGMLPGQMTQDYDRIIRTAKVHLAKRDDPWWG